MIVTKSSAVVFLVWQYFMLSPDAPLTVIVAAVLDGLMGISVAAIYIWQVHKQPESPVSTVGAAATAIKSNTLEIPGISSEKQGLGSQ